MSVAVADVDRDGKPDLLTANRDANSVSVLLNAGTGFATKVDYAVGEAPASLAVADLNGDSSPDVAVANQSEAGISLLLNDGNGGFFRFGVPTIGVPDSVAIADLNGDGWADFVNTNSSIGESTVSVHFNRGLGSFPIEDNAPVGAAPSAVALGDLNGDARLRSSPRMPTTTRSRCC